MNKAIGPDGKPFDACCPCCGAIKPMLDALLSALYLLKDSSRHVDKVVCEQLKEAIRTGRGHVGPVHSRLTVDAGEEME